ncbi:hypothetical protein [Acinetobacter haemolyticus]|uniref:Uncharacterized protein n=1 Tax=Acinetobacter haemolyticus TaxID=29430 RepID=A0A1L6KLE3_ACIHA|nr:hypothetical protein [Acinetobacter haemolyticus]APR69859.1 hypothetical protein AHTJS_05290 [Acinetobacter haemolyticus]QBQ15759.1 hypothetical protein AHTJR_05525 [Acinetobacter haemolyticus]
MLLAIKRTLSTLVLISILCSITVKANQYNYGYCSTSYGEPTAPEYVISSVFRIKNNVYVYHIEVETSFRSYIEERFDTLSASPSCSIRYESYHEAKNKRDDKINKLSNKSKTIVNTVDWSYE